MFNIFKTEIPTGDTKTVDEIESFTVEWTSFSTDGFGTYGRKKTYYKVFTSKKDATDFESRLLDASRLIKSDISTKTYKN